MIVKERCQLGQPELPWPPAYTYDASTRELSIELQPADERRAAVLISPERIARRRAL